MLNFLIQLIVNSKNHLTERITRIPDNITSFFIKHIIYSVIFPKSLIFNCSQATSSVPKQCKISYVILVHKKGSKFNPLNYRQISLTSSFCKIFEHIISIKILEYLFLYNLNSPKLFGFFPNRTCCFQLLDCSHSQLVSFFKH